MSSSRWPFATLALAALIVAVTFVAPYSSAAFDALVLDRAGVKPWALLTAHVLHTDWSHVGWNVFALACLGALAEPVDRTRFVVSLAVGVAAVDVWFVWFDPSLQFYCGLSGALNTVLLATLYALRDAIATPWLFAVAAISAAKVGWEWHTGAALVTHTRWPSAVGAHIAGFAAGIVLDGVYAWRDRARRV
ncbi:MAG TPA: rhombosortase [Pseudomonadales bacterium]|nr:rhombosortase [Pseudomonadales bacterium]